MDIVETVVTVKSTPELERAIAHVTNDEHSEAELEKLIADYGVDYNKETAKP